MGTHRAILAEGYSAFAGRKWVRWNAGMRARFLDHLAATCNVKASAAFIGVDPCSAYVLRRREPAFAAAWSEALALGYEMLETQLVGHALAGEAGSDLANGAEAALGPINVDLALRLLQAHRNAQGKPRRGGPVPHVATAEETDKAIMAKLSRIEARRKAAAAEAVAAQGEHADAGDDGDASGSEGAA